MWVRTTRHPAGLISDLPLSRYTCQHKCSSEHQCVLVHPESNWIEFKHHLLQLSLFLERQNLILAHILKWNLYGKCIQYNNKPNFSAYICVMTVRQMRPEIFFPDALRTDRQKKMKVKTQSWQSVMWCCAGCEPRLGGNSHAQLSVLSPFKTEMKQVGNKSSPQILCLILKITKDSCGLYGQSQQRLQDCWIKTVRPLLIFKHSETLLCPSRPNTRPSTIWGIFTWKLKIKLQKLKVAKRLEDCCCLWFGFKEISFCLSLVRQEATG